jgi:hypothetical protein
MVSQNIEIELMLDFFFIKHFFLSFFSPKIKEKAMTDIRQALISNLYPTSKYNVIMK